MSENSAAESQNYVKIGIIATVAVLVLTGATIGAYKYAKQRSGTTVLPGGTTYLGPSPTTQTNPPTAPLKFTINPTTKWVDFKGKVFPYTFSYPETLPLVIFPDDPTDAVAISWGNIPPQNNILIRINDLNTTEKNMSEYILKQKSEYVNNWWRQYSGLKGVQSVQEFVNTKGMKGYKAKFTNWADQTPNDDVFFEIPSQPHLVIRIANGVLDADVFNRIIDSFYWDETKSIKQVSAGSITGTAQPATGSAAQ